MINITNTISFLDDIQHAELTLVAVTAPGWCNPCKVMEPILYEVADEYPHLNILKLNPDENEDLCRFMNVSSVPTFIVLKSGNEVNRWQGAVPKTLLLNNLIEF